MNKFRRYNHLVRLGHPEVQGQTEGSVWVFPKLDGTNASVWFCPERGVMCGSRNRTLTLEQDNAGFCAWVNSGGDFDSVPGRIREFVRINPDLILYGEWLVPHTLKTYREDAWRRFWVFDVYDRRTESYLHWMDVQPISDCGIDVIAPLCNVVNPTVDQLNKMLELNTFMIRDGAGLGEGVVLKNYESAIPNQTWAKIVRNEFREQNRGKFGVPALSGEFCAEQAIVDEFVSPTLVAKTQSKVILDVWNQRSPTTVLDQEAQTLVLTTERHKVIPQLLSRVFHDLVSEELWSALKKHKNPTINFKLLANLTTRRVKHLCPELF